MNHEQMRDLWLAIRVASAMQHNTRYFLIKSLNFRNVAESIESRTWATQTTNEQKLNRAFRDGEVVLVFSINGSRAFQVRLEKKSVIFCPVCK